jgi:hypothetical protein
MCSRFLGYGCMYHNFGKAVDLRCTGMVLISVKNIATFLFSTTSVILVKPHVKLMQGAFSPEHEAHCSLAE